MKLAIMQPYLFPYLGYFQLIQAVDAFVIYDDVNYIKRGWINRNNILSKNKSQPFTMELDGASQNKLINGIGVGSNAGKLVKTFKHNYSKAPQYLSIFPLIEKILMYDEKNLSRFLEYQLRQLSAHLGLQPKWYISSELEKDNKLRSQDKILAICEILGASQYINMPGGKALYDEEAFLSRGVNLSFIKPKTISYRQFDNEFVPDLSIIDVMMFNSRDECASLLEEYEIV